MKLPTSCFWFCLATGGVLKNALAGSFLQCVGDLHLYQKDTPTQDFSSELCEILKNSFFTEHFQAAASGYTLI